MLLQQFMNEEGKITFCEIMNGFVFNNFWTASVLVPSIIYECTKRSTSWTASILIFEIIKKVKMRFVRLAVFGGKMFKISIFNEKFASPLGGFGEKYWLKCIGSISNSDSNLDLDKCLWN